MAVGGQLGNQLSDGRVFSSDLRVRVLATGLTTYPDVSVVCGRSERDPASPSTVTNPTAVVEVTSDGTEYCDRGSKLEHYQALPSIRTIVIVSHRERRIDVWTRTDGGFEHSSAQTGQRALVPALAAELDVDALYSAALEPGA